MASIYSILASSYTTAGLNTTSSTPYKAVDPKAYEGAWDGTLSNGKTFKLTVSQVSGFRAQVRYQSDGVQKFQSVLIKDNAFRIADTKFTLTGSGKAQVKSAVVDPVSGQTLLFTGTALQET